MFETIITIVIIAGAAFWLFRWIRGTAKGERGCSCGSCEKKCAARELLPPDSKTP